MLEDVIMLNQTKNGDELIKPPDDFPAIVVITCMLSVFSVIGTTGNAFVLYVFSRKKDKNTSTVFILALASIDFVTCIFVIPFTIFVEFMYKQVENDAVCKIYQFFITSNVPFSAFIMVAIAFDRYFCICRPWMKFINIRVAKKIILCLLALALSLGLITSLAYGVYHRKIVTKLLRNSSIDNIDVNNETMQKINFRNNVVLTNCRVEGPTGLVNNTCADKGDVNISLSGSTTMNSQLESPFTNTGSINMSFNSNDFLYTGFCLPNEVIFSIAFKRVYQKFYASLFLIAFVIVFILYALIYHSILTRRSKRLQTSLTEKQTSRMRSKVLTSIFNRRAQTPETFIMVANNADVNKNNQDNLKVNDIRSMRTVTMETKMPVTEITFCANDYKTEMTRATSMHSCYSVSAVNDMNNEDDDQNKDETSPLKINDKEGNQLKITSNVLTLPDPHINHKRKRTHENKSHCIKGHDTQKNTNKRVSLDQTEINTKPTPDKKPKENHRATNCNVYRQDTRKSVREKHRVANIKTAGILFIVTIVFIIAFLPAWLMATKLIPPNMIVFYTYFIYNVANPVIYAFFNQSFQKEMRTVLICVRK